MAAPIPTHKPKAQISRSISNALTKHHCLNKAPLVGALLFHIRKIIRLYIIYTALILAPYHTSQTYYLVMNFHAHVYWDTEEKKQSAIELREKLLTMGCSLGQIINHPIGPHPLPMYQVNYSSSNALEVETYLAEKQLTVLLHEDTGDHIKDHTKGARWIGRELKLNIKWLESIS